MKNEMKNENRIIIFSNSRTIFKELEEVDNDVSSRNKIKLKDITKNYPFDYEGFQDALKYIKEENINVVAVITSSGLESSILKLHEALNKKGIAPYPSKDRNLCIDIEMELFHRRFPTNDVTRFFEELYTKFPEADRIYVSSYTSCLIDPVKYYDNKLLPNPLSECRVVHFPFAADRITSDPVCSLVLELRDKYCEKHL